MPAPKIAINGFGRIGRMVLRLAKIRRHYDVVAINDLVDAERLAYAIRYDSVHGRYPGEVELDGDIPRSITRSTASSIWRPSARGSSRTTSGPTTWSPARAPSICGSFQGVRSWPCWRGRGFS